MPQSKLELAVGTGKWDAGLKKAQDALNSFTRSQGGLQQALDKENQKMSEFVKMMGKMDSTANTAKGQMNDYKRVLEQLTAQYNLMSDAQKKGIGKDYLQSIDALKQKFMSAKQQVEEFNRSIGNIKTPDVSANIGGGGLFGNLSDKLNGGLQVFAGNVMTKAAGWAASAVSEMGDLIKQSVELAKSSEGIRLAYERLNRPGLMDQLKKETHGVVSELELMKAAVKFNDFNLPVEELGTMLAFAQQKAKDTGQSVDYMVDSIVTGLGRKSLMILDNLGLSASQIKDKMKETGDMTTAVAAIIKEKMADAGDYVETAADRAAKANADLNNAMIELGSTLAPLEEQGVSLWTSIETGAINALNNGIKPIIPVLLELKQTIGDIATDISQSSWWDTYTSGLKNVAEVAVNTTIPALGMVYSMLAGLSGGGDKPILGAAIASIAGGGGSKGTSPEPLKPNPIKPVRTPKIEEVLPEGSVAELTKQIQELQKEQSKATNPEEWKSYQEQIRETTVRIKVLKGEMSAIGVGGLANAKGVTVATDKAFGTAQQKMKASEWVENRTEELQNGKLDFSGIDKQIAKIQKGGKDVAQAWKTAGSAVNTFGSVLNGLNDPAAKVASTVAQAIANVAFAYSDALAKTEGEKFNIWAFIAAATAATVSMVSTIATIHSSTGYAEGGIIKGNHYSGDMIGGQLENGQLVGLNAQEVVLNRAQSGNLASQLQGGGVNNFQLETRVSGDDLRIILRRSNMKRGYGSRNLVL